MELIQTLKRSRASVANMPVSCAMLLALGINFMWAEGHDQQRCVELIVLTAGLVFGRGAGTSAIQALPRQIQILMGMFLIFGAMSIVCAYSFHHAVSEWAMFAMLGLAGIIVAAEVSAVGQVGRQDILYAIAWISGFYSLRLALVYVAALAVSAPLHAREMAIGFDNYRFLNHVQTGLLPLLVLMACATPGASCLRRWACFYIASFWWALLFLGEARASLLGLGAGILVVMFTCRRVALPFLKTMAATVLGGILLYVLLFIVLPQMLGLPAYGAPSNMLARTASDPASGRQFLWYLAAELMMQHPLLGIGPQHFAHVGADLGYGAHPHDWIMQIGVEWGMPALLCLVTILLMGARGLLRANAVIDAADTANRATGVALLLAVTAIVVDSLFSGVLVMPSSQLMLVIVFGFAVSWVSSLHPQVQQAKPRFTWIICNSLVILSICGIAIATGPDLLRRWNEEPLTADEQRHNQVTVQWPRLWRAGYF